MIRKRTLRFTLISLVLALIIIGGLVVYVGYSFYFSPLPQTSGVKLVEGLQAPVTIYRDSWAIPQIYASNADDLFFAQGYVHAQDRWWQMEISRYLAAGRLRDILSHRNDAVLDADRWMLTLGLAESARLEWDNAAPQTRAALESYSAGVNAYIQSRSVESLASEYGVIGLTGEFDSLLIYLGRDVEVEPWEPYHAILLWKLFALSVAPSFWMELDLATTVQQDTSGSLLKLINTATDLQSIPLDPTLLQLKPEELMQLRDQMVGELSADLMDALGFPSMVGGNLWVVDGQHTDSGQPLLANDLHMSPEIPSVWYEMGLQCSTVQADCPFAVVGFSMAGIPGIVVGHNDQIAWGINPSRAKTQDLTLLELNPSNPMQYRYQGDWTSFETQSIDLFVTDSDEPSLMPPHRVLISHFGPVITGRADGLALALNWSGLASDADTIGALLNLNRAGSWGAFQSAVQGWAYPVMQIGYADVAGNIGVQTVGVVTDQNGVVIPFEQLPSRFNPSSGILVDANQWWEELPLEGYWAVDGRVDRVLSLLEAQEHHSSDSFAAIQGDVYSLLATELMAYVQALTFVDEDLQVVQMWLADWGRDYRIDSPQAAFFAIFTDAVLRLTFEQELNETQLNLYDLAPLLLSNLLPVAVDTLWDRPDTPAIEGRDDILRQAFRVAYDQLVEQFGDDMTAWRWGDLHQVSFTSRIIGHDEFFGANLALSSGLFPINQDPIDIGGSVGSLNHTRYSVSSPFFDKTVNELTLRVHTAPVYRVIIDLADFNNSRAMLSTGQSGHPASGNYKDMIAPWRTLEFHDLQWGLAAVREVSDKRLELEPESR